MILYLVDLEKSAPRRFQTDKHFMWSPTMYGCTNFTLFSTFNTFFLRQNSKVQQFFGGGKGT